MKKEHIDNAQPLTAAEHFDLLLKDDSIIDIEEKNLTPEDLPDWYDDKLFKEGQEVHKRNVASLEVAAFTGLLAIMAVPEILKVLVYTKQSGTRCMAFKRYSRTMLYMYDVYTSDTKDPNSNFYKMLNAVREKHRIVNKMLRRSDMKGIHQRDMGITQFGFLGYFFLASQYLGMQLLPEEEEAFNHLWRVIGYMLGISDRINICRKTVAETRELCRMIVGLLGNYLSNPPPHYEEMTSTVVNGMWCINLTLDKESLCSMVHKMSGVEYKMPLGWYDWLNMKYFEMMFHLFLVPYIGIIFRSGLNTLALSVYWSIRHFPFLAWIMYGKKNSQFTLYHT